MEAELEAQREALRDAEEAVMRERQVLQRRMAEIEDRADAARQAREEAVRRVSDDPNAGSSGKKGLLRRDAPTAKAVEELHVVLREREVELEEQERRLGELSTVAAAPRGRSERDGPQAAAECRLFRERIRIRGRR